MNKNLEIKKLCKGLKSGGGRNCYGRITVRHQGGLVNTNKKQVDFKRDFEGIVGKIIKIEADWSSRSSNLALIMYSNGYLAYMISTEGNSVGDYVMCTKNGKIYDGVSSIGSVYKLKHFNVGELVHSIELIPGKGAKVIRAAGNYGTIVNKVELTKRVWVKLGSGELRSFDWECKAVKGIVSNKLKNTIYLYKAGQNRWKGIRPTVRGVAMNPVDHPHGGGEGKTSGGRHPVTPWGRLTKGVKTRNKPIDKTLIIKRKKNK